MSLFLPYDYEQQLLQTQDSHTQQKVAAFQQAQAEPNITTRLGQYQKLYPWLAPGVSLSLSKSGVDPNSQTAYQTAKLDLARVGYGNQVDAVLQPDLGRYDKPLDQPQQDTPPTNASGVPVAPPPQALSKKQLSTRGSVGSVVKAIQNDLANYTNGTDTTLLNKSDYAYAFGAKTIAQAKGLLTNLTTLSQSDDPQLIQKYAAPVSKAYGKINKAINAQTDQGGGGGTSILGVNVGLGGSEAAIGQNFSDDLSQALSYARGVARTGFSIANAPLQLAQAEVRRTVHDVSQAVTDPFGNYKPPPHNELDETTVGQMVNHAIDGSPVDTGSGWLPDPRSPIEQARAQAARQDAPTIGGHAFTIGRGLAYGLGAGVNAIAGTHVLEPNSTAFNITSGLVDAAATMHLDPTAIALKAIGAERLAATGFEEAGAVRRGLGVVGDSPSLDYEATQNWLNASSEGTTLKQSLADINSPAEIYLRSKGQIPLIVERNGVRTNVLQTLADTTNPEAVGQTLDPILGVEMRNAPKIAGGFTYELGQPVTSSKLWGIMPTKFADPSNPNDFLQNMHRWMQSTGYSWSEQEPILNAYIKNPDDPMTAFKAMTNLARTSLIKEGTDEELASRLAQAWNTEARQMRVYAPDEVGKEMDRAGAVTDARGIVAPSPQFGVETLNRRIPFPDVRDIRRANSQFSSILTNKAVEIPESIIQEYQNAIWKPFHLAREGLFLRIFGDSQLSMAAAGLASAANHPLQWLGLVAGQNPDGALSKILTAVPGVNPIGMSREALLRANEDLIDPLTNGFSGVLSPQQMAAHGFTTIPMTSDAAPNAWAEELARLSSSKTMKLVASAESPEAAKEAFWNSPLRGSLLSKADVWDEMGAQYANDIGGDYTPLALRTRQGSDGYVDDLLKRIGLITSGDSRLVDFLRSGSYATVEQTAEQSAHPLEGALVRAADRNNIGKVLNVNEDAGNALVHFQSPEGSEARVSLALDQLTPLNGKGVGPWGQIDPGFVDFVSGLRDEGVGPDLIKARVGVTAATTGKWNWLMNKMLQHLVFEPDATFDRIPAYQSLRAKAITQLAPFGDAEARAGVLQLAADENWPAQWVDGLNKAAHAELSPHAIDFDTLTHLAKGRAIDDLPGVVHDVTSRSNAGDILRLLFPFGDAQRRVMARWANLLSQNPNALYRLGQGVEEAKEPNPLLAGPGAPPGAGFFHTDPVTGEQVYSIPFTGAITKTLTGVETPLVSPTGGLSIASEGMPGVGPVASVGTGYLLQHMGTAGDPIRNLFFKYGNDQTGNPVKDIITQSLPPFADKFVQAIDPSWNPKTFASTFGAEMKALMSTGSYDVWGANAAAETKRLQDDASRNAQIFLAIRGAAQFTSPGAPIPNWLVDDKSGKLAIMSVLADEFRKNEAKVGPDKAMDMLLAEHGPYNMFIPQSYSHPLVQGLPVTKAGWNWVRDNPDVAKKYPDTFGYVAPQEGKFDISVFTNQFDESQGGNVYREPISGAQMLKEAQNRVGLWLYYKKREDIIKTNGGRLPDQGQQAWLKQYRQSLAVSHPGFDQVPFDQTRTPRQVDQLLKMANDPQFKGNDAVAGLREYLQFRDQANSQAKEAGFSNTNQAQAARPLRDWLRNAAETVIQDHPDFQPMFEQVFSKELRRDI